MTLERESLALLGEALSVLEEGFRDLPPFEPEADHEAMRPVLLEVARRMQDNFPYPHPLYAGQMIKPPHPVARLAYMLSLWINPNNHALDGGRASSFMEKEAVAALAAMFGWSAHLGHLTSGGTVANLEALWVSGLLRPGKAVVASGQAHYTHERMTAVLKIPFRHVEDDARGRMDLVHLRELLAAGDVGTVVVTLGTTSLGCVDPLPEILALARAHDVRVHVDAAYGGYFGLAEGLPEDVQAAFASVPEVDSIVIDPHKHGGQPYGCGCVLFRDPSVGAFYKHDSPYTYFSSSEHHLGEITLECSRPGAAAVALWATQRLMPLVRGGALARELSAARGAAVRLHAELARDPRLFSPVAPSLDIVVWGPLAEAASDVSRLSRRIYQEAASRHLHLALTQIPRAIAGPAAPEITTWDEPTVTCLRACLMRADHAVWHDSIRAILTAATDAVLGPRVA
jgi:tyrosine decarboxylase/aspartate 1-decarboxylase